MNGAAIAVFVLLGVVVALICAILVVENQWRGTSRGRSTKQELPTTTTATGQASNYNMVLTLGLGCFMLVILLHQISIGHQVQGIEDGQRQISRDLKASSVKLQVTLAEIDEKVLEAQMKQAKLSVTVQDLIQGLAAGSQGAGGTGDGGSSGPLLQMPSVQADWSGVPNRSSIKADQNKLMAVRAAMKHAWSGYRQYAFGTDELKPVSNQGNNWIGMGATVVDALDTMWLMGMRDEFAQAREWVATKLNLNVDMHISFFECTIRCLGGLISAYELSNDRMFLDKATILGDKLLHAFKGQHGFPMSQINLKTLQSKPLDWLGNAVVLAEIGTVQMEFMALTKHTGDQKYANTALKVFNKLVTMQPPSGLYPLYIDMNSASFQGDQISLGAMGDSFYEYMLKVWIYGNRTEGAYYQMYQRAMAGVIKELVFDSTPGGFVYVAEKQGGTVVPKMDHLACFVPGMLALGAPFTADLKQKHIQVAHGIARTCREMSQRQASKVAPEFISFVPGNDFVVGAAHNLLRPEALEAMFVMYRQTGNPIYRQWGWEIFQGFEQSCRTSSGYSGLTDVNQNPAPKDDVQQSFFLAETLKYAWLLFSAGDVIPLDDYVLNTEAHPLKL